MIIRPIERTDAAEILPSKEGKTFPKHQSSRPEQFQTTNKDYEVSDYYFLVFLVIQFHVLSGKTCT